MNYLDSQAVLSSCGAYRYVLTRMWNASAESITFVMLNPSTASADIDDPTIRKCVTYTKGWGFGRLVVVNLFAFRATEPNGLRTAADPIGPENDRYIDEMTADGPVVYAWGATLSTWKNPKWAERSVAVDRIANRYRDSQVYHLGLTNAGHPRHPLYLPGNVELQPWPKCPRGEEIA